MGARWVVLETVSVFGFAVEVVGEWVLDAVDRSLLSAPTLVTVMVWRCLFWACFEVVEVVEVVLVGRKFALIAWVQISWIEASRLCGLAVEVVATEAWPLLWLLDSL